jgi:hypothetical protein
VPKWGTWNLQKSPRNQAFWVLWTTNWTNAAPIFKL